MNTLLNTNETVTNTLSKPTRVSKYYNEEDQQSRKNQTEPILKRISALFNAITEGPAKQSGFFL